MFILASGSPRRKELLKLVINEFEVIPSGIEETVPEGIKPEESPEYLAWLKAKDISARFPNDTVIGADTSVIIGGKILGKPDNSDEAREMLSMLSGKTHKVITGCAVCEDGKCRSFSSMTEVEFYKLSDYDIDGYISSGEPFDKAGAYGIQGKGALLVKKISGDFYNVVGLPVAELARFLKD